MSSKRTNTLAACAFSLSVKEEVLEAALPLLREGVVDGSESSSMWVKVREMQGENERLKKELAAAKEVNGEAAILGQMFSELLSKLRSSEHGKSFITVPDDSGESKNYAFIHRIEEQHTRFKSARVRLCCSNGDEGCC